MARSGRRVAGRVRFAPRYAQYLALMLFAHWVDAQLEDADAFLARLNGWLDGHQPKDEPVSAFVAADLQLAAFWMATAAGKTHVLHACLALLERRRSWDRLILITPSEALTRQHADRLRGLAVWEVFAYPMDGDAAALGRLPPDAVIVLDINKRTAQKKGDGVTVPTSVFSEGRNLVLVDEGHKGQRSEASVWKSLQANLAGMVAPRPAQRGLLIEFSATFGQVAEGEHAFGRYTKTVVFDYAYDRFHQDRYGKDFWHVRVQADRDAGAGARGQTLTAALLAFWHQVTCLRSAAGRQAAVERGLGLAVPLWVLLGLSVIGSTKNAGDKEQTSDVVEVLCFLSACLGQPDTLRHQLASLLATATVGADLLPAAVRGAAQGWEPEALAGRVLGDCFHGLKSAYLDVFLQGLTDNGVPQTRRIVWILDYQTHIQTFGFVDPKGMALGTAAGWSDYKIVSTLYLPHVVERQLTATSQTVTYQGAPWTFRVRGVLVSTASFTSLSTQAKFQVRDAVSNSAKPTEADFRSGRVLFPRDDTGYIDEVLTLLTEDTAIDPILALAAQVLEPTSYFTPAGELQHELRLRQEERNQPDAEFIGALLADYLQPDADGQLGAAAIRRRRQQLMDYAISGRFGFGAETAAALRDHPAPREALWTRKQRAQAR